MLTIVFYATNGAAAKQRARAIAAVNKGDFARCYDVGVWDGTHDRCESVEIMADVPDWQRDRISSVFGAIEEQIVDQEEVSDVDDLQQEGISAATEGDASDVATEGEAEIVSEKRAVHRGGGRWFVMSGEDIISGPHDKAEAARIAQEV